MEYTTGLNNSPLQEPPVQRRKRFVRWLSTTLLVSLLAACSKSLAAYPLSDPASETRIMVGQALTILHDTSMPPAQRRRQLMKLAESKLDFERMARGSLGQHWAELTAAQRERFLRLFTGFVEAAYLNKIQDYANLDIQVGSATFAVGNYARVEAKVAQPGSDGIPITFMLERHEGTWMLYDVAIENVRMIENYRAQFDRVIRAHGISRLMADLQAKQAQLGSSLGVSHGAS